MTSEENLIAPLSTEVLHVNVMAKDLYLQVCTCVDCVTDLQRSTTPPASPPGIQTKVRASRCSACETPNNQTHWRNWISWQVFLSWDLSRKTNIRHMTIIINHRYLLRKGSHVFFFCPAKTWTKIFKTIRTHSPIYFRIIQCTWLATISKKKKIIYIYFQFIKDCTALLLCDWLFLQWHTVTGQIVISSHDTGA